MIDYQLKKDIQLYNRLPIQYDNPSLSVIIRKKQTHMELAQYLHASCFSPVQSTFVKAIKNKHFKTWPGLTEQLINKHLPTSIATVQGHIHQQRQNLQSTKSIVPINNNLKSIHKKFIDSNQKAQQEQSIADDYNNESQLCNFPPVEQPNKKTN